MAEQLNEIEELLHADELITPDNHLYAEHSRTWAAHPQPPRPPTRRRHRPHRRRVASPSRWPRQIIGPAHQPVDFMSNWMQAFSDVKAIYGPNYTKLATLKTRYDLKGKLKGPFTI